jgi:glyceraldehyde 3-phosphate dehydrogenase
MSLQGTYEQELAFQADRRRATVEFIKIVSDLWYDKSIELVLFRNQLIDRNVSEILHLHEYAGEFVQKPISVFDSVEIAKAINQLDLPPAKLDIGKLTYEYHMEDQKFSNALEFVIGKLHDAERNGSIEPKDVVLYGFGRIGRLVARELMTRTGKGSQLRLRAIVTRGEINQTVLREKSLSLKK